MRLIVASLILTIGIVPATSGDPTGKWKALIAEGKAPPAAWWNNLANRHKGLCCSGSDGLALKDIDWDTKDGHYRVHLVDVLIEGTRIKNEWITVPDDAVVDAPNLYSSAVVWPYLTMTSDGIPHTAIRCFLKGFEG